MDFGRTLQRLAVFALALLFLASAASAQHNVRVAQYNCARHAIVITRSTPS